MFTQLPVQEGAMFNFFVIFMDPMDPLHEPLGGHEPPVRRLPSRHSLEANFHLIPSGLSVAIMH